MHGSAVYFAGAVAVVHELQGNRQHFFRGHGTNQITSLARHPAGEIFATGQGGAKPTVCIWNSVNRVELARLPSFHEGRIACMAFSTDGNLLMTVSVLVISIDTTYYSARLPSNSCGPRSLN